MVVTEALTVLAWYLRQQIMSLTASSVSANATVQMKIKLNSPKLLRTLDTRDRVLIVTNIWNGITKIRIENP